MISLGINCCAEGEEHTERVSILEGERDVNRVESEYEALL